jgi:hypothetical protein
VGLEEIYREVKRECAMSGNDTARGRLSTTIRLPGVKGASQGELGGSGEQRERVAKR